MRLSLAALVAPVLIVVSHASLSSPGAQASPPASADPDQKPIVLDLVIDVRRLAEPPTPEEQRELLERAEKTLNSRLDDVKIYPGASREAEDQYLRLRAPEASGYTRERLVHLATATGDLAFQTVAVRGDLAGEGTSLTDERERFDAWRKKHPKSSIDEFADLAVKDGGPHPRVRWVWSTPNDGSKGPEPLAVLMEEKAEWRFSADDLEAIHASEDNRGHPALGFRLKKDRGAEFKAFTASIVRRQLAVVVGDRVLMAPAVNDPLPGVGIITGGANGFTEREVDDLIRILRHPLLDVPLRVRGKGGK